MKTLFQQLKWQFILLQKNNIVSISFGVTLIYGVLLFFLRDVEHLDKVLVALVLNDPSVIGYFFIALAIYLEMKHQILPAIFVTPVIAHHFIISKSLALSIIGTLCSIGLAISVMGLHFAWFPYVLGSFGICMLCALLGIFMLSFSTEFLKFAMLSVPVFMLFINVPMLQYLKVIDMGAIKYLFPAQGSIDLIDYAVSGSEINFWYAYFSILAWIPLFYILAYRRFTQKVIYA